MSFTMSNIERAADFAKVFQEDKFLDGGPNGQGFDREYLKQLSPADRKVCFKALDLIERATLSDFVHAEKSVPQDLQDRITDLTSKIEGYSPVVDLQSSPWWKAPFVKIAKLIQSIAKGILNFFGRVSTEKLFNKVEAYRRDVEEAKREVEELKGSDSLEGKISLAEKAHSESFGEKLGFVRDEFFPALKIFEALNYISYNVSLDSSCQSIQKTRASVLDGWFNHSAEDVRKGASSLLEITSFREFVVGYLDQAQEDIQNALRDLYELAINEDNSEESVKEKFIECLKQAKDTLRQLNTKGNQLHEAELELLSTFKRLEEKDLLLNSKYF